MSINDDRFGTAFSDVFVVVYQAQDGQRHVRQVLAGSLDDARQTHQEHHPEDQIIEVAAIA